MTTETVTNVMAEVNATPELAAPEVAQPEVKDEAPPVKTEEEVAFPKKAVNAISRRDKKIGELRAREQQLRAELEKFQSQAQQKNDQPKKSDGPQEDEFDNYGDFLKAVARYEARQELAQGQQKPEQTPQPDIQEQVWVAQREAILLPQIDAAVKDIPGFQEVLAEYADVIEAMPKHLEHAFLECENLPAAVMALEKEGKLEALLTMSPARAAMEIAKAEMSGVELLKAKPITNAPTPMTPNKGTATAGTRLENMSGDDILKSIRG